MEFEEEGDKVRVFLRTWDVDTFRRVFVATLDRYSSDPHQEVTALGGVVDALGAVLSCMVKWGKCMRPCAVSMTTLLFLIKYNPIIGPVNFFITTKCSAEELSPISNFSVAVDTGFSNLPLATCI